MNAIQAKQGDSMKQFACTAVVLGEECNRGKDCKYSHDPVIVKAKRDVMWNSLKKFKDPDNKNHHETQSHTVRFRRLRSNQTLIRNGNVSASEI
jgi:hypothetical protein